MGVYLYLASDQVRFCDLAGDPRPLEQVPPLVFSEMMRDVDLFVGVASVGNDPLWQDHGEERFNAYWDPRPGHEHWHEGRPPEPEDR